MRKLLLVALVAACSGDIDPHDSPVIVGLWDIEFEPGTCLPEVPGYRTGYFSFDSETLEPECQVCDSIEMAVDGYEATGTIEASLTIEEVELDVVFDVWVRDDGEEVDATLMVSSGDCSEDSVITRIVRVREF